MNEETSRYSVQAQHSTICCAVYEAVGCGVTRTWRTCRLAQSITKNTYSILNVIVRTQKKSHAQISDPFCLRNDRQAVDGPRRWVRCIYLATVLAETLNPSRASSAWILR